MLETHGQERFDVPSPDTHTGLNPHGSYYFGSLRECVLMLFDAEMTSLTRKRVRAMPYPGSLGEAPCLDCSFFVGEMRCRVCSNSQGVEKIFKAVKQILRNSYIVDNAG